MPVDTVSRLPGVPEMGTIIPIMGTRPDQLSEHLFGKTRAKLLGLLYGQPDRSYYLTELFRMASVGRGAVQRELARLESLGLVTVRNRGNQKLFQANTQTPVFPELEGLIRKTAGIAATFGSSRTGSRRCKERTRQPGNGEAVIRDLGDT